MHHGRFSTSIISSSYALFKENNIILQDPLHFLSIKANHMPNPVSTTMQQRLGRRLVLFPFSLQGHINPMFDLANILYSKGFSISFIYTRFNSLNPATHPHFTFHAIDDGLSETESSTEDLIALATLLNEKCVEPFRKCLSLMLLDDSVQEPVACIITDAIWHFSQAVADEFKLHRLALRTSNVTSLVAFVAYRSISEKGYLSSQDTEAVIPELPPLRVKDIPKINTRDPKLLQNLISDVVRENKASSGLIFNSFEELEAPSVAALCHEFSVPVYLIGPFHKCLQFSSSSFLAQDRSSISWLDTQPPKSVLYVSFGSLATINQAEFVEMAWGLAYSNHPFLWVVRPHLVRGLNSSLQFPDKFLEEVKGRSHIISWAPQLDVLAHPSIGGFWTHNGWNSTLESICAGVPMICHPFFGDQRVNARYVSDVWKVGLHLENRVDRDVIEKIIRRLMVEKDGGFLREKVGLLKENADDCLVAGGSSYKSLESLINGILSF